MQTINIAVGSNLHKFVRATFPSYRKKKVFIHIHDYAKTIQTHPGGWDDGSIDYDYLVDMENLPFVAIKANQATLFNFDRELGFPKIDINEDRCMITDGIVSSKPATIFINCTKIFHDKYLNNDI